MYSTDHALLHSDMKTRNAQLHMVIIYSENHGIILYYLWKCLYQFVFVKYYDFLVSFLMCSF